MDVVPGLSLYFDLFLKFDDKLDSLSIIEVDLVLVGTAQVVVDNKLSSPVPSISVVTELQVLCVRLLVQEFYLKELSRR